MRVGCNTVVKKRIDVLGSNSVGASFKTSSHPRSKTMLYNECFPLSYFLFFSNLAVPIAFKPLTSFLIYENVFVYCFHQLKFETFSHFVRMFQSFLGATGLLFSSIEIRDLFPFR